MSSSSITFEEIKTTALGLGWDDLGITSASIPDKDIQTYKQWLSKGYHADLKYMENTIRCDPQVVFPGAKTAIIFVTYYKQESVPFSNDAGVVASYARGRDYHKVHRKRLKRFISWLEERSGQKNIAKGFSDSTPLLEKALAVQAGLGWFGKNTLLIHRRFGTFTLLSGVLTTLEFDGVLEIDERKDRCGACNRCMEACPTQAIVSPFRLDAGKCLSYHLIESKKDIPDDVVKMNPGYVFGCDICQDVCPHNARRPVSLLPEFMPIAGVGEKIDAQLMSNILESPEKLHGTPLQRRGTTGLKYSLDTLKLDTKF